MQRDAGWIQCGDGAVFLHLHEGEGRAAEYRKPILIVPGLGEEYFHGYRALRFFADSLAESGHLCVRMDFSGCGNSGEAVHESPVQRWKNNVSDVSEWIRNYTGCEELCFLAHRSGALFISDAVKAADEIVLWGPVPSGRAWLRELKALSRMGLHTNSNGDFESGGLWFDEELQEAISSQSLELLERFSRMLIIDQTSRNSRKIFSAGGEALDSRFSYLKDAEYSNCVREPHLAVRPAESVRAILSWLAKAPHVIQSCHHEDRSPLLGQVSVGAFLERRVDVSGLFGILADVNSSDRIVLLGNAGSVHTVGPNRLNVELARALAQKGISVLRYDLSNLGDSVSTGLFSDQHDEENHPYPASTEDDVAKVVRWARQSGYRHITLAGLCSGAYAAFDFARTQVVESPDEILLINSLTFDWQPGMSLEIPDEFRAVVQHNYYRQALQQHARWKRLLTGKSDYGQALRHIVTAFCEVFRSSARRIGEAMNLLPQPAIARDLLRVTAAGTKVWFVFSADEPGIQMLQRAGRSNLETLINRHLISIDVIDKADHTFRQREQRRTLVDIIIRKFTHDRTN